MKYRFPKEIELPGKKLKLPLCAALVCGLAAGLGSETYRLITYYPAPYGSYAKFKTTGLTLLAQNSGGRVTIGTPASKNDFADNKLEIGGIMILDKNTTAPDAVTGGGGLRWNGKELQYNNGTKWTSISSGLHVIAGSNPACPAGEKALMLLAKGGTSKSASVACSGYYCGNHNQSVSLDVSNMWFSPEAGLSGWSKVLCGDVTSSDGTALLVNSNHSAKDCTSAGGAVASDGAGNSMCRFSAASCPSGWQQYQKWSQTYIGPACQCCSGVSSLCSYPYTGCNPSGQDGPWVGWAYCYIKGHPFSDNGNVEGCSAASSPSHCCGPYSCGHTTGANIAGKIEAVGCY